MGATNQGKPAPGAQARLISVTRAMPRPAPHTTRQRSARSIASGAGRRARSQLRQPPV
jgi:hypothetical protein